MPDGRRLTRTRWSAASHPDPTPPLNHEDGTALPSGGRPAHARWFAAIIIMSGAAIILMWGALYAAFGSRSHFALVPAIFRRVEAIASSRGGRLAPGGSGLSARFSRTRVEDIDQQAQTSEMFTHIVASLADSSDPPALAQAAAPVASGRAAGAEAAPGLPAEILAGTSKAEALLSNAPAYAEVEPQAPGHALPGQLLNVTTIAETASGRTEARRVVFARPGDTLQQALGQLDMAARDIAAIVPLLSSPPVPDTLSAHDAIILLPQATTGATSRPLKITLRRAGSPARSAALADSGDYVPVADLPAEPDQTHADAPEASAIVVRPSDRPSLRESLQETADRRHIDRALVEALLRVCAHDVDLDAPVSAQDSLELLAGDGDGGTSVLAFAALNVGGRTHRYYRYTPPDGDASDYYDPDGRAVMRFLLRKPVAAGRLGDGFGWRIHPILRDRRFHEGVDYAAPMGSPIVAAGAGVVEKIDEESGYGKYVRILHDFGYETTYAHISGVPRGLRVGARVQQGQTIAFIGSTGLSTGPHLYYELRVNGRDVDPLRIRLPAGRVLDGRMREAFDEARLHTDVLLQASGQALSP